MGNFHRTHYKKIELTDDISLRYFFEFEDIPDFKNKWVIKSHDRKEYEVITRKTAKLIAETHNKTLQDYVEIIGRETKNGYMKIIVKKINIEDDIMEQNRIAEVVFEK